ncbi:MAG: hypothetical protein L0177_07070 [Chloroflexi bacterium]|nr:hypothetical protein [Chloroflexota bacterium]
MATKRDAYKYNFVVGDKIVYRGVTSDLNRAEQDHQVRWPDGYIVKVGIRTTWGRAQAWVQRENKGASAA